MQSINTKSILWIDIAKFIGIFLVIYSHCLDTNITIFKYSNAFINLFFMPLFFILSGYLYKDKGFKNNISKILWSLLIPYLIYQFLYLPWVLGNRVLFHSFPFWITLKKCLIGILIGDIDNKCNWYIGVCGTCWFIMCMIQLRLFFSFIPMKLKYIIPISVLSALIVKFLQLKHLDLFFCLDNLLVAIPYFVFGYILKNNIKVDFENYSKKTNIILTIICFIFLLVILKLNWFISYGRVMYRIQPTQSIGLVYLAGVIGTLMIIFFANLFKSVPEFVSYIGRHTLFIIYFHYQLLFFVHLFFKQLLDYSNRSSCIALIISLTVTTILLIINYFVIKMLSKYCPVVLGKRNKLKGE